jgi:Cu2+-exporting ATPase
VKPGDKLPVDGKVVEGEGHINESMLSGESREILKQVGSKVSAGTINLEGSLIVEVVNTLENTRLGRIIHLVEDAQGSKATIQCTTEKIMPWFVSVTVTLATVAFIFWYLNSGIEVAIMAGTAVLIITCPCALGLATPMAMAVAAGVAARRGLLVKNTVVLETLHELNHFVFDKTGTLTQGRMKWVEQRWLEGVDETHYIPILARIEEKSEHSLARAIVNSIDEHYPQWRQSKIDLSNFKSEAGKGVRAQIRDQWYYIGTRAWLLEKGIQPTQDWVDFEEEQAQLGRTSVWIAQNEQILGVLFMEDALREDAQQLIQQLKASGKSITLLSGDRHTVAHAVANQLGGGIQVIAEVLPEDKSQVIVDLQQQGHKVAMVGDGINDAPALVRANIGIALGGGTDVSMDSADLVLLNNRLMGIDTALKLSSRTLKTVKENIMLSIAYNVIMVPLAMAAMLTPLIASITMPLSGLLVILNAMRIRRYF